MHTPILLTALATMAVSISATPINHNQAAAAAAANAASTPTPNAYAYAATPIPTPQATPGAATLPLCGNDNNKIPYQPTTHTCHPNGALCPILNGTPLAACGQACYDARIYRCGEGDALELSPEALRNGTGIFPPAGAVPSGTPPAVVVAGGTPMPTPTPGY